MIIYLDKDGKILSQWYSIVPFSNISPKIISLLRRCIGRAPASIEVSFVLNDKIVLECSSRLINPIPSDLEAKIRPLFLKDQFGE